MDLIISEYDDANRRADKYFDFMYKTVQIFFAAIMTIIVFALKDTEGLMYQLLLLLIIPIIIYVFGLFYCYNNYAISKLSFFQKICEYKIKILSNLINGMNAYLGWTYFVAKKKDAFILPYGTLLAFFIVLPIGCILLSFFDLKSEVFLMLWPVEAIKQALLILSTVCYLIYIIFLCVIIYQLNKMIRIRANLRLQYTIDNERIIFIESY